MFGIRRYFYWIMIMGVPLMVLAYYYPHAPAVNYLFYLWVIVLAVTMVADSGGTQQRFTKNGVQGWKSPGFSRGDAEPLQLLNQHSANPSKTTGSAFRR